MTRAHLVRVLCILKVIASDWITMVSLWAGCTFETVVIVNALDAGVTGTGQITLTKREEIKVTCFRLSLTSTNSPPTTLSSLPSFPC